MRSCRVSPGAAASARRRPRSAHRCAPPRQRGSEVERHHRDPFELHVGPDVELGPVRQRELRARSHPVRAERCRCATAPAAASAGPTGGWPTAARTPAPSPRLFSSSRRAPPSARVETVLVERLLQSGRLPEIGVHRRPVIERVDALRCTRGSGARSAGRPPVSPTRRGTSTSRGTSRWCRRAAAGTATATGRTPCEPDGAAPSCPCPPSTSGPGVRCRPRPRAGCGWPRLPSAADASDAVLWDEPIDRPPARRVSSDVTERDGRDTSTSESLPRS